MRQRLQYLGLGSLFLKQTTLAADEKIYCCTFRSVSISPVFLLRNPSQNPNFKYHPTPGYYYHGPQASPGQTRQADYH